MPSLLKWAAAPILGLAMTFAGDTKTADAGGFGISIGSYPSVYSGYRGFGPGFGPSFGFSYSTFRAPVYSRGVTFGAPVYRSYRGVHPRSSYYRSPAFVPSRGFYYSPRGVYVSPRRYYH